MKQIMNTRADKTQENKSQSAANAGFHKKSISGSAFQFVDNRPGSIQMQKMQNMANNSHAALQLKKLQSGKLNVVGEHHKESTERRQLEISLAREEVGGGYWTEDQFRIRDRKFTEFFEKGSESDPRAFGDPLYLRIAESIRYVEDARDDFNTHWKEWIKEDQEEEELAEIKVELQKILAVCKTHLNEAYRLLTLAGNNEERKSYNESQEFHLIQIGKYLGKTKDLFLELAETWKGNTLGQLIVSKFFESFQDFSYQIDILCISAAELGGADLETTSKLRSDAMDKGAEKGKNIVGVWKIGYDHVGDIKGKMEEDDTKNYVLIDRDEFNDEYKQLPILVDGKMMPQVGSSGNKVSDSITNEML